MRTHMPKPKEPPDLDVVFATIRALGAELERERLRRQVAERSWKRAEAEVERLVDR